MRKVRTNFDKTRWTEDEVRRLHELAPLYPVRHIAALLGREFPSVRAKMQRLGIEAISGKEWRPWDASEVAFLEEHHETMPVADIATALNRSEYSIKKKCFNLGLSLARRKYSDEDVSLCRQLFAAGVSRKDIAEKMEIPCQRVTSWILGRERNNVQ